MLKPNLFIVRKDSITCTGCRGFFKKFSDIDDIKWGNTIQQFMEDHIKSCEPEEIE